MLITLGYPNVRIVSNGREAVDAVHAERFELVLMDIMVSIFDCGFTMLEEICKVVFDHTHVILIDFFLSCSRCQKWVV